MKIFGTTGALALVLFSISAGAAEYPAPKQGEWVARDFKFHTGEVMPELKEVSPWHTVGQRRSLEEMGRAAEQVIDDSAMFGHEAYE